MVSLEQVKLLETKVAKTIDYIAQVNAENAALREKLESYQKRIGELEILIKRFKEEQSRIEDGILSALDRLNQFEIAVEKSLKEKQAAEAESAHTQQPASDQSAPAQASANGESGGIFFEIPESEADDDVSDPLEDALDEPLAGEAEQAEENSELDIF